MRIINYEGWIAAWVYPGGIGLAPHIHRLPEDDPDRRLVIRVAERALARRAYCERLAAIEIPSCGEAARAAWPCWGWYLSALPFPTLRALFMAPSREGRRPGTGGRMRRGSCAGLSGRRRQ